MFYPGPILGLSISHCPLALDLILLLIFHSSPLQSRYLSPALALQILILKQ